MENVPGNFRCGGPRPVCGVVARMVVLRAVSLKSLPGRSLGCHCGRRRTRALSPIVFRRRFVSRAPVVAVRGFDVLVRGQRKPNEPCPVVFGRQVALTRTHRKQSVRDPHVKMRMDVLRAAKTART